MAVDEIMTAKVYFEVYYCNSNCNEERMIASAVATLTKNAGQMKCLLTQLVSRPEIEIGAFSESCRRIPLTIDSPNRQAVEQTTNWLQGHDAIAFVDVVFVHFEETDIGCNAAPVNQLESDVR